MEGEEKPRITILGADMSDTFDSAQQSHDTHRAEWEAKWQRKQERRDARRARHHDHHEGLAGVFLLFAGVLLLLNTLGLLPWDFWREVVAYWPVLVILIGLHMIFGKNSFSEALVIVIAILTLGFITIRALDTMHSPLINHVPLPLVEQMRRVPGYTE